MGLLRRFLPRTIVTFWKSTTGERSGLLEDLFNLKRNETDLFLG